MSLIEKSKTEKKIHVIYSCKAKDCKHIFRIEILQKTIISDYFPSGGPPARDFTSTFHFSDGSVKRYISERIDCPKCEKQFSSYGKQVKGILKPGRRCDARCTNAKGHNCKCSCGGKNHGNKWN